MSSGGGDVLGAILGVVMVVLMLLIYLVMFLVFMAIALAPIVGHWKLYGKAGRPGWAAIVPVYNKIVHLEITGRPIWWVAMLFIPIANIVFSFIMHLDMAKAFGKDVGWGIGLIFLPWLFYPLMGFGDATYQGPIHAPGGGYPYPDY